MSAHYAKSDGITLVGGGALDVATLDRALTKAPWLVAADGGADAALALGRRPDLVIGDFDSLSEAARAALGPERLHRVATQDDTDFDKALGAIDAPFILAVGFTGGRLDHTLAAMNTLVRNAHRRVIVDTGADLCLVLPPQMSLAVPPHSRISLFPMGPVRCASQGLVWDTTGLDFNPAGKIGTSNAASGGPVTLGCDRPAMLLLVPVDQFDALFTALDAAPLWQADARAQ